MTTTNSNRPEPEIDFDDPELFYEEEDTTHVSIEKMLEDCKAAESKLSDWERGFISSVSEQFINKGKLSEKQLDKLQSIWEQVI